MNRHIERIKGIRIYLLQLTEDLSADELNKVPEGFNNNVIWNLAHIISAQQRICYVRAGQPVVLDEAFVERYKPGTKAEEQLSADDIQAVKAQLLSTIDQLEADLQTGIFDNYTAWDTRYGVRINTINDAVEFLLYHDGLHTGYMMAQKRLVKDSNNH